jgi:hypothetical protein
LSTPVQGSPDVKLVAHVNGSIRDNTAISSYEEFSRNAGIKVKVGGELNAAMTG